jgi:ABC-type transporter Mla MlaB component
MLTGWRLPADWNICSMPGEVASSGTAITLLNSELFNMLRITVEDATDHVRLKLEGNLCGPRVTELEERWRAATPTLAGRQVKLDSAAVSRIDSAAKYLLALLRGTGAELIASGAATREIVERIALDWPGYCGVRTQPIHRVACPRMKGEGDAPELVRHHPHPVCI